MTALDDCLYPGMAPLSAYTKGCHCARCLEAGRLYRALHALGRGECNYPGCSAERRAVQGARFCDTHAALPDSRRRGREVICAHCHEPSIAHGKFDLCTDCRNIGTISAFIKRAAAHRLSPPQVNDLVRTGAWTRCALCGCTTGPTNPRHIDHDHDCCPSERGCDACFRGVLCSICNLALGHIERLMEHLPVPQPSDANLSPLERLSFAIDRYLHVDAVALRNLQDF